MSLITLSATTVFDEPCTVTAKQVPSAVMVLPFPLTRSVDSLQSIVWSIPIPVMCVSPLLACAAGAPSTSAGSAIRQAAADRRSAFQPPAVMAVERTSWARSMAVLGWFCSQVRVLERVAAAACAPVQCPTMRWRVKAVAIAAVTAVVTVGGCAQTVGGTAHRAHPAVPDPDRSYGYVDDRCGLLEDNTIQEMLGAKNVVRPYSGAVCQYVLERDSGPNAGAAAPSTMIDVIFSWFETGSLDRERTLA